ncbi:MAG: helix-turn-helix transcriptional regulator, partial [Prevotella sp.]
EHLQNERRDKIVDLSTIFPQLSPSELEVARLILKNMSLKEIAVATGKSLSNVGTVRGNIRKKLGLGPDDDLRNYLLSIVPSQTNY